MQINAYDIKEFYQTKRGAFVQQALSAYIHKIWPDVKSNTIVGAGYAFPYLKSLADSTSLERYFGFLPSSLGGFVWPEDSKNKAGVADFVHFPLVDECVDRCLMVHGLEFVEAPDLALQDVWRILRANGRLLIVVPNRAGFWAGSDATPFGHGHPYSFTQLRRVLKEQDFVIEQVHSGLYTPPYKSKLMLNMFGWLEKIGPFCPLFSGVHIIEASKQVYAFTKPIKAKSEYTLRQKLVFGGANPQPS
ncbi:MAG: hypothetical protein CMH30_08480 [Micavibrio sp.]|nr:hypothetical protein [Micavibrio sp.]|tara:strand:+ start:1067 stop:1807 length:741 start_codon:yes stop_codon:yes gene_type:complete